MIITILGWGSLIWDPRSLQIDTTVGDNGWHADGPTLPIEFARISNDGRLTLVIVPDKNELIQTLYAFSKYDDLDEAILDLAVREGCGKNKIGYYNKQEKKISDNFSNTKFDKQRNEITKWINNKGIDAVIWTNLSPNHKDRLDLDKLTPSDAVNYLKYLSPDIKIKAEEYIRKAPKIIDTPIRKEIEKELDWKIIT